MNVPRTSYEAEIMQVTLKLRTTPIVDFTTSSLPLYEREHEQ